MNCSTRMPASLPVPGLAVSVAMRTIGRHQQQADEGDVQALLRRQQLHRRQPQAEDHQHPARRVVRRARPQNSHTATAQAALQQHQRAPSCAPAAQRGVVGIGAGGGKAQVVRQPQQQRTASRRSRPRIGTRSGAQRLLDATIRLQPIRLPTSEAGVCTNRTARGCGRNAARLPRPGGAAFIGCRVGRGRHGRSRGLLLHLADRQHGLRARADASARSTAATWSLTVSTDTLSSRAISLLAGLPAAARGSTSLCRRQTRRFQRQRRLLVVGAGCWRAHWAHHVDARCRLRPAARPGRASSAARTEHHHSQRLEQLVVGLALGHEARWRPGRWRG